VLWILGDLVGLPFLAAQLIHFMREDESDAAQIDAELDAREAAGLEANRTTAAPAPDLAAAPNLATSPDQPTGSGEPPGSKPWWEDDPRFTSRFKPT
jgi:hypothetical protein